MTNRRTIILSVITAAIVASGVTVFAATSIHHTRRSTTSVGSATGSRVPDDVSPAQVRRKDKGEPLVNWDRPFIDGVAVPSVAAAAGALPFKPALPSTMGTPEAIYVHGDLGPHPELQALGLVFNSASSGQFIVTEEPTKSSTAELQQLASTCDPTNGCQGSWTMVTLSDGTPALEIAADVSTGLIWINNGVRYDVFGPTATFNSAKATELANAFEAATT